MDGVVTVDEQAMLDDMALYLGLEPDEVEDLDKKVREEAAASLASGGESLYRTMLEVAWQDGEVDDNEQAMLDSLAAMLGLSSSRDVQLDWVCDQMDDRLKAYCAAMEAAWEDGQISTDEDNMLQSLRNSLQISTAEHRTITGAVRAKLN
jgi:tellurite resistance protein